MVVVASSTRRRFKVLKGALYHTLLLFYYINHGKKTSCNGLSTTSQSSSKPPQPVRRIAIVGSGIAGLSVAHALTNRRSSSTTGAPSWERVDIFDARPALDATAGAGIQLNGGLSVLGLINPSLQEAVYRAGLPQVRVQSRSNTNSWWSRKDGNEDSGKKQETTTLLELDLKQTVKQAGGLVAASLLSTSLSGTASEKDDPRLLWISIMRGALQDVLYRMLPREMHNKDPVQFEKKLIRLLPETPLVDGGGVRCEFADGTVSGPYDLVIGCEGINSVVKCCVDSNGQTTTKGASFSSPSTNEEPSSTIYSGLRIRYAVADGDPTQPIESTATLTQFFGNGAYALHGTYGAGEGKPNAKCTFIVYLDDNYFGPFKRKGRPPTDATIRDGENADWSQDQRTPLEKSKDAMIEQLDGSSIPSGTEEDFRRTIRQADRFFELGSYFHNPFRRWSCRLSDDCPAHVVLCGDAAHALPPFLGQGSNQAIQDAYCLVEKIVEYNRKLEAGDTNVTLLESLQEYESIRWPACFNVFWKAAFLGYLETGGVGGFYSEFRNVFFRAMGVVGVASKVLLNAATPKI